MAIDRGGRFWPQDRDKISFNGTLHELRMTAAGTIVEIWDSGYTLFRERVGTFIDEWGWGYEPGIWRRLKKDR